MSPGKINFAWKSAVGSTFGKITSVHLEGQVLLVDAATPHWVREIRRATPVLLRRLRTLLGEGVVTDLVVRTR
jgi:hypothetical protein